MNLKNNKGYTGVDVSVAIIIIMLFIPTIFGMTYNINKTKANITKKSYASQIATKILNIAKTTEYEKLSEGFNEDPTDDTSNFLNKLISIYGELDSSNTYNDISQDNSYQYCYFHTTGENGEMYEIQVGVKDFYPANNNANEVEKDILKKVKVRVAYSSGAKLEKFEISIPIENKYFTRKELLNNETE